MSRRSVLIILLLVLFIAGFFTYYIIDRRIPMDPANVGNTAGNLQNKGYFFEMDGKVFFANSSDNYCLYSMNVDESKPKRLSTMGTRYINGADGILYFYMDSTRKSSSVSGLGSATNQYGIYRCKANGANETCLHRDFCGEVNLCGEYVYYQSQSEGGTLRKIRCDKKEQSKVADEMISPVCYSDRTIYYTGVTADHDIHTMFTNAGDTTQTFLQGYLFFPVVQDGYIYYLDGDKDYSLWRTNLYSGESQLLSTARIDCFNVDRLHIYYSTSASETPALVRCNLDGSDQTILYEGIVNSINLTSQYIYFKLYDDDSMFYHMPIDGSGAATPFIVNAE